LVDEKNNFNILQLSAINSLPFNVKFSFIVNLLNFKDLTKENLNVPEESSIEQYDSLGNTGLSIVLNKSFDPHSELKFDLALPMIIKSCDIGYVNYFYHGIIVMSIFIISVSFSSFYLYKE